MTILHDLVAHSTSEKIRKNSELHRYGRRAFIDWLAATIAGTAFPPAPQLRQASAAEMGYGKSHIFAAAKAGFPAAAAWLNGTAAHAAELDDIFRAAVYHPGAPIFAAALAAAQDVNCTIDDLYAAISVGYEVSCRFGAALQPDHNRYFHATGTLGGLGAAAAVAQILAPGNQQVTVHAVATAASFAAGLQQALREDAMTKAQHSGHSATMGLRAAQGAFYGVQGAVAVLDGEVGFGPALSHISDWSQLYKSFADEPALMQLTHKAHACCGHLFPAIDAAISMRAQLHDDFDRIDHIEIETYSDAAAATGRFDPKNEYECKFSLPFGVAHALIYGHANLDAFTEQKRSDPLIRRLMSRTSIKVSDEMTKIFPRQRHSTLTIVREDGEIYRYAVTARKGDPELPLTDDDINAKFIGLASPILGVDRAQLWLQAIVSDKTDRVNDIKFDW